MIRKKNQPKDTPTPISSQRPVRADRKASGLSASAGGDLGNERAVVESTESSSTSAGRLSSAIMRILASARGATEGRRAVTAADLIPSNRYGQAPASGPDESTAAEDDASSGVEWTLRMMQ